MHDLEGRILRVDISPWQRNSFGYPKVSVTWVADKESSGVISEPKGLRKRRIDVIIRSGEEREEGSMTMTQPVTTAQAVANYLIWKAHESGSFISNLKLQKLLYYAQAWHLAIFGRRLFLDRFQAWVHGPVVPAIYGAYKKYGWRNIDEEVVQPAFDQQTAGFLEELLDEYGGLDALRLEWMTHHEDPWVLARQGIAADETCSNCIDEAVMESFYRGRLRESGAAAVGS